MKAYPEIASLKQYFGNHDISIQLLNLPVKGCSKWVEFRVDGQNWRLLIEDEFDELQGENQVLKLFLVLSSLEGYIEASDFLEWARDSEQDAADPEVLDYFRSLDGMVPEIKNALGSIEPYISCFDYHMNAGAAKALRNL